MSEVQLQVLESSSLMKMTIFMTPKTKLHLPCITKCGYIWHVRITLFWFSLVYQISYQPKSFYCRYSLCNIL